MLLPGASTGIAAGRAESMRAAAQELLLTHDRKELPRVTLSLGIATFPAHASSARELLEVADRALYVAKANGRNRMEIASASYAPTSPPGEAGSLA